MRPAQFFFRSFVLAVVFMISSIGGAYASGDQEGSSEFDPIELINGHVWDSHDFHIIDWKGESYGLALPIILWTDDGLVIFPSSRFHHDYSGTVVVEEGGQKFVRYKEHIFYADKLDVAKFEEASAIGRPLLYEDRPLNFSITKTVFSMMLAAVIMLLIFGFSARHYKKNKKAPKGLAGFMEPLIIFVRDDIAIPNIGEKKYQKYMPYLLTVFFLIWIGNLFGLIPFFPFQGTLTNDILFTGVLATFTFLITLFSGNKGYWGHIFATPGVPKWLLPIMIPVEVLGMFTKP